MLQGFLPEEKYPGKVQQADVIELDPKTLHELQLYSDEMERLKLHAEALEHLLSVRILRQFGIDLSTEHWTLDLQEGTLKRDQHTE